MHFVVIGAGNMGCVYGANLARAGRQVSLVDVWVEHVQAIETRGLRMEGLHGSFTARVQATVDPARVRNADVALICVNAYHTAAAAATAVETLSPDGFVVPLQNGLGNVETLVQELGETRVLPGLTFHSGDLVRPGQVTHTNQGPTYLGELDGSQSERLLALRDVLAAADMNPVLESDIMATIWQKVVLNCAINAICAITDLRPGHISEVPELDEFQTRIVEEVLALARARGITLPEPQPLDTIKEYCASKFHRVSMLQHLQRGRATEIDALNGYVARESQKLGLPAPCNDALTRLMKGRHHRPDPSRNVG